MEHSHTTIYRDECRSVGVINKDAIAHDAIIVEDEGIDRMHITQREEYLVAMALNLKGMS